MTEDGNTTISFASLLFYLMLLVLPVPHVGIESNFLPLSKASSCVIAAKQYTALRGTKISLPFLFGVHLALKPYTGRWIRKMCVVNSAGVKPCSLLCNFESATTEGRPRNKVFYPRAGVRRNGYRWWDFIRHRYAFSIRFKNFSKWI